MMIVMMTIFLQWLACGAVIRVPVNARNLHCVSEKCHYFRFDNSRQKRYGESKQSNDALFSYLV